MGSVGKGTEAKYSAQASLHMLFPPRLLHWFLNVFVGMLELGSEVSALGVGRRGQGIPAVIFFLLLVFLGRAGE